MNKEEKILEIFSKLKKEKPDWHFYITTTNKLVVYTSLPADKLDEGKDYFHEIVKLLDLKYKIDTNNVFVIY